MPPHIFDVTDLIQKAGRENTIEYWGLFQGESPNPRAQAGYIMMQSNLVFMHSSELADA